MQYTLSVSRAPELARIVIGADQDIKQAIVEAVAELGWKRACITNAVGSVKDMVFTVPTEDTLPLKTREYACPEACEITGFTGEIMEKEQMDAALKAVYKDKQSPLFAHIHASCAGRSGVFGGGFKRGRTLRSLTVYVLHEED